MQKTSSKVGKHRAVLKPIKESQVPFLQELPKGTARPQPLPAMKPANRATLAGSDIPGIASTTIDSKGPGNLSIEVQKVLGPLQVLQEPVRLLEQDAWLRPGDASVVNWLVEKLDQREAIDWDLVNTQDVVGYLKRRLAEFGPLLSKQIWVKFAVSECTIAGLRECLAKLPLPNRILIVQFLHYLHRLNLDAKLLAIIVLAPALANDQNLTDLNIQLKAQLMIEQAAAVCDAEQG